jgi:hypothetical protein
MNALKSNADKTGAGGRLIIARCLAGYACYADRIAAYVIRFFM